MGWHRALSRGPLIFIVLVLLAGVGLWVRYTDWRSTVISGWLPVTEDPNAPPQVKTGVTKEILAQTLTQSLPRGIFPSEVALPKDKLPTRVVLQYAFDVSLQDSLERLVKSYAPDYGAVVVMDATTGRVLSMISSTSDPQIQDNLALRATFPSASVFKVVTAAAAIEARKLHSESLMAYNGGKHTLYKHNVLKSNENRFSHRVTLREAFASSINSVFGRIGAFVIGSERLSHFADRFAFNRKINSDLPVQTGKAIIPRDDWGLAETASGYTRDNTMSPLQGALISAAIVNRGIMMEPYIIESAHTADGTPLYRVEPKVMSITVDHSTADELKELMRETITHGTSRKSFRGFFKSKYSKIDVGGKTGSLTGTDPVGKYDWFVGYADDGKRKIAISALTVHRKYWKVKSSYLARRAIELYYQSPRVTSSLASGMDSDLASGIAGKQARKIGSVTPRGSKAN